jgi:polyisoprenoid-binding protein YceI
MTNETKWTIDQAHSDIEFKVRHLMIAHVKGKFKTFDASIYTVGNNFLTADIDLWIDVSSISTGDLQRDEHLKSKDFFDAENFKQITFTANTIGNAVSEDNHELWGDLTIKGITKNIKLNIQFGGIAYDSYGYEKAGFTVTGIINRSDWGLVWNSPTETSGVMVSDNINITCEIELINKGKKDLSLELKSSANGKSIAF